MPHHTSTHRSYRLRTASRPGEIRFQTVLEETDLWVTARSDLSVAILDEVRELRTRLKNYMAAHPDFGSSLTPLDVQDPAPGIVRVMARAAKACAVGPMAAVAGSIAQAVADRFVPHSPDIIVENGGDVYIHSTRDRTVGLLSRPEEGVTLGLALGRKEFPLALCASSGRIGHSLSFGSGDLVVVKAKDGAFADAAATALANRLQDKKDVDVVLVQAKKLTTAGLLGVFAQFDDQLGIWGRMELVEIE